MVQFSITPTQDGHGIVAYARADGVFTQLNQQSTTTSHDFAASMRAITPRPRTDD
jgi:hypothetical protein